MFATFAFIALTLVCFFVVDDLFIDLVALFKRLGPKLLSDEDVSKLKIKEEKQIAIIIANWHEANVIGRMIAGNIRGVDYKNYHFFLGVYPNDMETLIAVQNLEAAFPKKVHMVINEKDGPTSKGQMLNEVVRGVLEFEKYLKYKFDVFLMHDSEDIMHPLSLKVINSEIENAEFLQTPVFSFDRPIKEWVGSTYIEEFAEIHTKDLFVRQALGAPVPSAGTGTALDRKLMIQLMNSNGGNFLREDSLTEDYVLGMSAALLGFKTAFVCFYRKIGKRRDFIATREYFPNSFRSAIRQKTRWILGIVFQGQKIVPWVGNWSHKYFLYRDRRGPWNNTVAMATTALTIYLFTYYFFSGNTPAFMSESWFHLGSFIATVGMFSRLFHRLKAVIIVIGWKKPLLSIVRWPLGNIINFLASFQALREFYQAQRRKEVLKWSKTTHELPEGFGDDHSNDHPDLN